VVACGVEPVRVRTSGVRWTDASASATRKKTPGPGDAFSSGAMSRARAALGGDPNTVMGDLKNPKLIYLKGFLFLVAGTVSAAALLVEHPSLRTAFLLGVAIWSFCRLYYFLFYVIEKYVDGTYRFVGIGSFLRYLLRNWTRSGRA
jgi:hypothetical protein